jgi:hypothetical protein
MKRIVLMLCLLCCVLATCAQNRNATVKALNNYVLFANANNRALTATLTSLERYDGLFHDFLKSHRQLGGEAYEKPKTSPFVDADVFTIGEDDPAHLYAVALKGATSLPAKVKTELNASMKGLSDCSQRVVLMIDSMSNLFHGPLITVTTDSTALPYRLLYAAGRELQTAKTHRDALVMGLQNVYAKSCAVVAPKTDYIQSVVPLTMGLQSCQHILDGIGSDQRIVVMQSMLKLDSLRVQLESRELTLLKGISPIGNSKQFPNKGNFNGFDLYDKYEDILVQFAAFSRIAEKYLEPTDGAEQQAQKSNLHRAECLDRFNGNQGLVYMYNEYVLLIGGGKMKLLSEGAGKARYIYRGWSDGSKTLPLRSLLFGMMDVPMFAVRHW